MCVKPGILTGLKFDSLLFSHVLLGVGQKDGYMYKFTETLLFNMGRELGSGLTLFVKAGVFVAYIQSDRSG